MSEKLIEKCFVVSDPYRDKVSENRNREKRAQLHYWYVDRMRQNGKEYILAHGIVSGHKRLTDTMFIHTSEIQSITINKNIEELIIATRNTEYYCPWNIANGNSKTRMPI